MSAVVSRFAAKEFRALLPVWAASAVTVLAEPLVKGAMGRSVPLAMLAFIVGALALGAHAVGHEYTNRTLGMLLAQPWRRSSMLATKAGVLAAMLLALASIAWPVLWRAEARGSGPLAPEWQLVLPLIGGLFVAPWMTMRLRGQLAGVVFTASIPGTAYLLALLAGILVHGTETDAAERLAVAVWKPAMLIFAASGAILSARSFMHLQADDGGREELQLPRWVFLEDRRPIRPPLWMLVKKELRLQQMTFALAVFYAVIWTGLTVAARLNTQFGREFPIEGVGLLYFALLPLLMGSLASAQERQFGMLQSQAMLPVPFAYQWAVKAGVVLVLALGLGVALPWIVFAPPQLSREALWPLAGTIGLLTIWSLYISSWCASGIIALALILPASAAALTLARWIDSAVMALFLPPHRSLLAGMLTQPSALFAQWMTIIAAGFAVLLLVFAARNHWTPERQLKRLPVQLAWLAGWFVLTDVVTSVL